MLDLIAGRRPKFTAPAVELVVRESTDRSPESAGSRGSFPLAAHE
jgi:hypothetical protein